MNNKSNNNIPSLSWAEFIKMNSVVFMVQLMGQIIFALIGWVIIKAPEPVIALIAGVSFAAAWFGGIQLGHNTVEAIGAEAAFVLTGISIDQFIRVSLGVTLALLAVVSATAIMLGGHAAIALVFSNFLGFVLVGAYYIEVASAAWQEEQRPK